MLSAGQKIVSKNHQPNINRHRRSSHNMTAANFPYFFTVFFGDLVSLEVYIMIKKIFIGLTLPAIILSACHKNQVTPVIQPGPPSMVGKWNVDTVVTYFYDNNGLRGSEVAYPAIPNIFTLKYRFDPNNMWNESGSLSPHDSTYILGSGVYAITSDSTFILMYSNATPNASNEDCKVISLSSQLFVFSKQRPTVFNGIDSGYIKYVFRLSK